MADPSLLFVAGLGRSGTTALAQLMAAHPHIALGVERYKRLYPNKDEPITPDLFGRERFFDFSDDLTNLTPDAAPQFSAYYDQMRSKWDSARYVGDKMGGIRAEQIWSTAPQARFLCIVRALEPVAASWEARAQDPDDTGWRAHRDARRAVVGWNRTLRQLRRAVRLRPDQVAVVEYDQLFGDPGGLTLGRALAWLGLEKDPAIEGAFGLAHRHYVDTVRPKERGLPPDVLAYLSANADRDSWTQVQQLAL